MGHEGLTRAPGQDPGGTEVSTSPGEAKSSSQGYPTKAPREVAIGWPSLKAPNASPLRAPGTPQGPIAWALGNPETLSA